MGLLIYGRYSMPVNTGEVFVRCSCCQRMEPADLLVSSDYFHIYFLPIFPFDKTANLICRACGCKRYGLRFNAQVVPQYEEIKKRFRHPLRVWTGTLILAFPVVVAILAATGIFK